MAHDARVLAISGADELADEMRRIGVEPYGVTRMIPKAQHYVVKLYGIRTPLAHILKESFLSAGGDAAVSRDVVTSKIAHTDVILIGTRKQYSVVADALRAQKFDAPSVAAEIETTISNFDSRPAPLPPDLLVAPRVSALFDQMTRGTLIMGILNVTPDSFSDGGLYADPDAAAARALEMVREGANIIDVGGESSRPGAEPVAEQDETARVLPVIERIRAESDVCISVDTYKCAVAQLALDAGADMINDISGMSFDPQIRALAAERRVPVVLMHIKGTPRQMQVDPAYDDLLGEISAFLRERIREAVDAGVDERLIIIDPGFGFGKTVDHNLTILRRLREFKSLGRPILIGPSRKSTIGHVLGDLPPDERLEGTAAAVTISIMNGASIVRVHDVKEMSRVARMTDAVMGKCESQ